MNNTKLIVGLIVLVLVGYGVWGMNGDESATSGNVSGAGTTSRVGLPDGWPSDAPVYESGKITYSGVTQKPTESDDASVQLDDNGIAVIMTTDNSVDEVYAYYKGKLNGGGWKIEGEADAGPSKVISAVKSGNRFSLVITDANGSTLISSGISVAN